MNLDFIKDLNESSQYRTRQSFKTSSTRQVSNHLFLDSIAIWILYNEYQFAPVAIDYAKKTKRYGDFSNYRQSATDMYLAAYALSTKDKSLFSDNPAEHVLLDRIKINEKNLTTYLTLIANNTLKAGIYRQYIQKLERNLKIDTTQLKSLRRASQLWGEFSDADKAIFLSKMFKQYRMYARKSELYQLLKSFYNIESLADDKKKTSNALKIAGGAAAGLAGFAIGREIGKRLV
jgi:hypothetical protein